MNDFDAFVSYSHATDGKLAPSVQSGLQRLAKRPFQRRALSVFRDETGLSTNPHLWSAIEDALDSSGWFILLASPDASRSEWVAKEVATWIQTKPVDRILIVVTDGVIAFDNDGRVDPSTDCLPTILAESLEAEPRWLDLRWARTDEQLDLRNGRFRAAIADLAAPIHGIAKDDLESDDVRQQRRLRRMAIAGIVAVSVLAIVAGILAGVALAQRNRADDEAIRASARSLASQATALTGSDVDVSLLLAAEGYRRDPSIDTESGLLTALDGARLFTDLDPDLPSEISDLEMTGDRALLLVLSSDGEITSHDPSTMAQIGEPLLSGIEDPSILTASADGSRVAFVGSDGVGVIDLASGDVVAEGLGDSQSVVSLNREGTEAAVGLVSEPFVRVYDLASGAVTHEIEHELGTAVFVADDELAVMELGSPVLTTYDIAGDTAEPTGTYDTGVAGGGIQPSPDGDLLIVGGLDGSAVLIDTVEFEPVTPIFRSRGSRTGDFFFSPDGALVGMSGDDGSATIIDTSDGTEVATMAGMTGSLVSEFLNDTSLVSASFTAGRSSLWNLGEGPAIGTSQHAGTEGVVTVKPMESGLLAYLGVNGAVAIAPADDLSAPVFTRSVGDYGRAFDVAETAGRAAVYVLEVDEEAQAVTARTIEILNLDDLSTTMSIDVGERTVNNIAFDPSGSRLAVGSDGGELTVYDVVTGAAMHGPVLIDDYPAALGLLVWSDDGARLHTGGQDGVLRTFDTETWEVTNESTLIDTQVALRLGSLSADGSTLVVPAETGEVYRIDEQTGDPIGTPFISAGTQLQRALLIEDGRTVAAISRDGSLRLFDVASGRTIGPALFGHAGFSQSLEARAGHHLVSGGAADDLIVDWNLDRGSWFERACALAGRNLTEKEWSDYVGGPYQETCDDLANGD